MGFRVTRRHLSRHNSHFNSCTSVPVIDDVFGSIDTYTGGPPYYPGLVVEFNPESATSITVSFVDDQGRTMSNSGPFPVAGGMVTTGTTFPATDYTTGSSHSFTVTAKTECGATQASKTLTVPAQPITSTQSQATTSTPPATPSSSPQTTPASSPTPPPPPDRIGVNAFLHRGGSLYSANGKYRLTLQDDGNLVLYNSSGHALWATNRANGDVLALQSDGNLVVYTSSHKAIWASNTGDSHATYLVVQDDGNVVLYSGSGHAVWATNTAGGQVQSPSSQTPAPAPGTHAERESIHHPAHTFANYHNASGQGPSIAAGKVVRVSCKVHDGTIPSADPDGYWYRIASSPWNNKYYAPANTFLNGDPPNGPYSHNTDFAVPDCGGVGQASPAKSKPAQPESLSEYANHIVQWDGDHKRQKTSWLVGPDLKRRWIPDIATYHCLITHGVTLWPTPLSSSILDRLPDLTGVHANCTSDSTSGSAGSTKTRHCGIVTCTDYYSRHTTAAKWRFFKTRVGSLEQIVSETTSAECVLIGSIAEGAAALAKALGLFQKTAVSEAGRYLCDKVFKNKFTSMMRNLKYASNHEQCFYLRFLRYGSNNPFFGTSGYTNTRTYCRD